jgi:DNA-binding PucR family transcriptional regulator
MNAFIDRVDAALWLIVRRWTIRQLRKLVDVADDRLHATEVRLREEISLRVPVEPARVARSERPALPNSSALQNDEFSGDRVSGRLPRSGEQERTGETWQQWEARRSGIAPITKKAARQRRARMTASAFDLKYAR